MYIAIFICLFLLAITSLLNPNRDYRYYFLLFALSGILCFRYGQGTDYFTYELMYSSFSTFEMLLNNPLGFHAEWGYRLLCVIFNFFHADFTVFIFCVSVFEMIMLHRFLTKYSHNTILSLFLFFPTFYLTYYFSGIRQGIVLAIFLGFMVECLFEKKWIKYFVLNIILVFIHSSALILLIAPFALKFKLKTIYIFVGCGLFVGTLMSTRFFANFMAQIPIVGAQLANYLNPSISWMGLMERVISFLIVVCLFHSKYNKSISVETTNFMKLYAFGLLVYFVFVAYPLVSSRMMMYFKVFEVILISCLLIVFSKERLAIAGIVFAMATAMFFKNIGAYMAQSLYFDTVNIFTYPYISVFNKEDLWNFRPMPIWWLP